MVLSVFIFAEFSYKSTIPLYHVLTRIFNRKVSIIQGGPKK